MTFIVLWVVCLLVGIWLGNRKKIESGAVALCVLFGPLGLLILAAVPDNSSAKMQTPGMKLLYERVANEISASQVDKAAWARSIADSNGSPDAAKSLYVKYRVEHLVSELKEVEYARYRARMKKLITSVGITIPILLGLAYLGSNDRQTHSLTKQSATSPTGGFVAPSDELVPSTSATGTKAEQKFDPNQPFAVESTPQRNPLSDLDGQMVAIPATPVSQVNPDDVHVVSPTPNEQNTSSYSMARRKALMSQLAIRNEEVYKMLKGLGLFQTDAQAKQFAKQNHIVRTIITIETIRRVGGATHVTPEWWDEQIFNQTGYPVKERIAIRNTVNDCFEISRELNAIDNAGGGVGTAQGTEQQ